MGSARRLTGETGRRDRSACIDRVLRGELDESLVAAQGGGESEKA
jgi:hypothetical protein